VAEGTFDDELPYICGQSRDVVDILPWGYTSGEVARLARCVTDARPGSDLKVAILVSRYEQGIPLFDDRDEQEATPTPEIVLIDSVPEPRFGPVYLEDDNDEKDGTRFEQVRDILTFEPVSQEE